MKKMIFYDLDGTLVDTREDIAQAANHMRKAFGKQPLGVAEISRFVGRGLRYLVVNCLETVDEKSVEKGIQVYKDFYSRHMLDHSRLYDGVREFLEYFHGRRQAVITNKPNPFSVQMLETLGVAGYFFAIIDGHSGYPKKPAPDAILSFMERDKVEAEAVLLVGDSPIDIETGRNAGVEVAGVSHGFSPPRELESAKPHYFVENFQQLLDIARQRKW